MPKMAIKNVRQQQCIDATLRSVGQHGLQDTTINFMTTMAKMSWWIISHYFEGKQRLIEVTLKDLLNEFKLALFIITSGKTPFSITLIFMISEVNLTGLQPSNAAKQPAAVIDSFRQRNVLSSTPKQDPKQDQILSSVFIDTVLVQYGENQCRH